MISGDVRFDKTLHTSANEVDNDKKEHAVEANIVDGVPQHVVPVLLRQELSQREMRVMARVT
jgi:hypothetical protein